MYLQNVNRKKLREKFFHLEGKFCFCLTFSRLVVLLTVLIAEITGTKSNSETARKQTPWPNTALKPSMHPHLPHTLSSRNVPRPQKLATKPILLAYRVLNIQPLRLNDDFFLIKPVFIDVRRLLPVC